VSCKSRSSLTVLNDVDLGICLSSALSNERKRTQVQSAVDSGIPTQLSYGFISGYCSGLAMKKAGKAAAGMIGE